MVCSSIVILSLRCDEVVSLDGKQTKRAEKTSSSEMNENLPDVVWLVSFTKRK